MIKNFIDLLLGTSRWVIIGVVISGCEDWIARDFKTLKEGIPPFENSNYSSWNLEEKREIDDKVWSVIISTKHAATTEALSYFHDFNRDSLEILYCEKRIQKDGVLFHLEFERHTSFYYYNRVGSVKKTFVIGEYYYKFKRGMLNELELGVFLDNFDSLKKVKGIICLCW